MRDHLELSRSKEIQKQLEIRKKAKKKMLLNSRYGALNASSGIGFRQDIIGPGNENQSIDNLRNTNRSNLRLFLETFKISFLIDGQIDIRPRPVKKDLKINFDCEE